MTPSLKKRFWKTVAIESADNGFFVTLDGHKIRTPAKAHLSVPTEPLAKMVATEWDAQEGEIDPTTMPATRAANAALDKVAVNRDAVIDMLVEYGNTDLILYRADSPQALNQRQAQDWDPLIDWAQVQFGHSLNVTSGIMPVDQSVQSAQNYRSYLQGFSPFELTALHDLITLSGSFVIGAATAENHLKPQEAWRIARLDETWQQEQWGEDEEASQGAAKKQSEFLFAHHLLKSLIP